MSSGHRVCTVYKDIIILGSVTKSALGDTVDTV